MKSPLRILFLEDDPGDVKLVRDVLHDDGLCEELIAVDNREGFLAALEQDIDLILADYALPTFDGLEALDICRDRCPDRPFIFVTGALGEERAIESLKRGATDYVMKSRLSRLALAVRRAISEAEAHRQRREAEVALRENEEKLRMVLENSRDGISLLDLKTKRYVFTSPALVEMTEFNTEDLRNLSVEEFNERMHPDDRELSISHQREVAEGQDPGKPVEYRWKMKSGEYRWFSDSRKVVCDEQGRAVALVGVIRDITEQKSAVVALRESEEKFRNAFINAAIGFAMVTIDGRFVDANAAYCRLIGYDLETLRTITQWQLIHTDDWVENKALIDRMLFGQIVNFVVENRYFHKNGQVVWVRKSVSLVRNAEGTPQWIIVLVEDITERKRIEEALREADRRKDEFLAILGHEMRNPIAVVSSAIKLLNRPLQDEQKEIYYKSLIEEQIQHMDRIISDLLDISRIVRGKIKLEMQEVRVAEVVNKSLEAVRKNYEEFGHSLLVDCPSEPLLIIGDPSRLQQILINLLSNAGKYTPSGGHIHLVVELKGKEVVLRVKDDGIGIPLEAQSRIFDMFAQVESGKQWSQGGLGIGLSLVKTLTEMQGGSISVYSAGEGQGSEFIVRFPQRQSELVPLAPDIPFPYVEVTGLQVLVVDDNYSLASMLADSIEEHGHFVQHAHDGLEAVAVAQKQRPDVVLLDIGLPKLDGYEVARRLRNELALKETLTIATTAWGQERDRQRSVEAGIDHHLVKPVDYSMIAPLISQWYLLRQNAASTNEDVLSTNLS